MLPDFLCKKESPRFCQLPKKKKTRHPKTELNLSICSRQKSNESPIKHEFLLCAVFSVTSPSHGALAMTHPRNPLYNLLSKQHLARAGLLVDLTRSPLLPPWLQKGPFALPHGSLTHSKRQFLGKTPVLLQAKHSSSFNHFLLNMTPLGPPFWNLQCVLSPPARMGHPHFTSREALTS